ncbi:MAG: Trk system potassium transporter TrkA [Desulfomonilaceae bacterium]|nr:Trk system potassium transporter TrkA [Desulfomonilaceae bacterium]
MIVGAGEMGYHLARRLSYERQDVVVIEKHAPRVNFIHETLDVQTIHGRGSSPAILKQAGIEKAGVLVAVTDSDEVNLVACFVAHQFNKFMTKIARLRQEDYHEVTQMSKKNPLEVDLFISPEHEAIGKLIKVLQIPSATDVIDFAEGRIKLFGIQLKSESPLVGLSLIEVRDRYPDDRILIPALFRDSEAIIPRGRDVLRADDTVYVISGTASLRRVMEICGLKGEPPNSFMILGGTDVGVRIAMELEKERVGQIRLVESDLARCEEIASMLDYTMVLKADSVDEDFLRSEGISEIDAFLAVTEDDEHNALTALLAKRMGVGRVAALTNKVEYHRLLAVIGVDVVVNPRLEGASRILQYIRKGKVMSVSMLPGEGVEAIEFEAMETSHIVGKPLQKVRFPTGAILGAVERGRDFFIPDGNAVIQPGDRIIVFATRHAIPKVEKLITVSPNFFG